MSKTRTYKQNYWRDWLGLIITFFFTVVSIFSLWKGNWQTGVPFYCFFGSLFLSILFSLTERVKISQESISLKTLLKTKTLAWDNISRVSSGSESIKLHNSGNTIVISLNSKLQDYEEIINQIGIKRPDLFNPQVNNEISGTFLTDIPTTWLILITALIGYGFWAYKTDGINPVLTLFYGITIPIIIAIMLYWVISSPKSVIIQEKSIVISYPFSQKELHSIDLISINFGHTIDMNGAKNYFVVFYLRNENPVYISDFRINLPITYLVLKNWHKQNTSTHSSSQQN